jgi:hypothetical protein
MTNKLEKQGWIKRTILEEPKLSEIIKEYYSLGFDVHLEPVTLEDLDQRCDICYKNQIEKFKTVYIKKRK